MIRIIFIHRPPPKKNPQCGLIPCIGSELIGQDRSAYYLRKSPLIFKISYNLMSICSIIEVLEHTICCISVGSTKITKSCCLAGFFIFKPIIPLQIFMKSTRAFQVPKRSPWDLRHRFPASP